jgi:hypothetical protein
MNWDFWLIICNLFENYFHTNYKNMKNYLLPVFVLFCLQTSFGQIRCDRPLSNVDFSRNKQTIASQYAEGKKMQQANEFLQQNCITVGQLKEILVLFTDDLNRLQLAQTAQKSIFDKENIFEVFDSFQKLSTAFRWYDYMQEKPILDNTTTYIPPRNNPNTTNPTKPNNSNDMIFPDLDYPFVGNYTGKKGCNTPNTEENFMILARRIKASSISDNIRYNMMMQQSNNCLTTSQVMRLATLLSAENMRLEYLKLSFAKVFDTENFQYSSQTLQNVQNQEALAEFIRQNNGELQDSNGNTCNGVSEQEYAQMTNTIAAERISSSKMEIAKGIVENYKCFSVEQVRGLMKLFSLESQKLEVAKMMYASTSKIQKKQYYTLANEFRMSSYKTDLMDFIKKP